MPRLIARSMVSLGMFCALASETALRSRAFASTSPLPPVRAATVISLISLVKSLPRLASRAPFLCLIVCHLECPDMRFYVNWQYNTLSFCLQNGADGCEVNAGYADAFIF